MSECTNGELRDLLPELVNGRLDAAMRDAVETHVASCTECADELALLRSLRPALMREPAIDTPRIAAAVRARTAGGANLPSTRRGISTRWRLAVAAATLLAVSALGYMMRNHRTGAEEVAGVSTTQSGTRDTGYQVSLTPESLHVPKITPPGSATVHPTTQQIAVTPPRVAVPSAAAPSSLASTGVLDNVSDLSDDDVRTLTASLDRLSSIPDADPSPDIDPLGATLEDLTAGGR